MLGQVVKEKKKAETFLGMSPNNSPNHNRHGEKKLAFQRRCVKLKNYKGGALCAVPADGQELQT